MEWQNSLQQKMLAMKTTTVSFEEKEFNKNERSISHWVSKKNVDRGKDIVLPNSLDQKNYRKNPIVLFNHNVNYPVASNAWLKSKEDGVYSKSIFATTPFADDVYTLNVEKVLNAWSLGFTPVKWEFDEKSNTTTFTNIELLEYSNVSIPMHQDAITEGLKMIKSDIAKNILTDARENYEIKATLSSLKSDIEELRKLRDDIMEDSQGYSLKDGERLERELMELKNKINKLTAETSGGDKFLKQLLETVRTGDVSGKK